MVVKVGTKKFATYGEAGVEAAMGPSLLVAAVDGTAFDTPLGLWVGTAGTANLTFLTGTDAVDVDGVPLIAGWNQIRPTKVRSGGTASGIYAGY